MSFVVVVAVIVVVVVVVVVFVVVVVVVVAVVVAAVVVVVVAVAAVVAVVFVAVVVAVVSTSRRTTVRNPSEKYCDTWLTQSITQDFEEDSNKKCKSGEKTFCTANSSCFFTIQVRIPHFQLDKLKQTAPNSAQTEKNPLCTAFRKKNPKCITVCFGPQMNETL